MHIRVLPLGRTMWRVASTFLKREASLQICRRSFFTASKNATSAHGARGIFRQLPKAQYGEYLQCPRIYNRVLPVSTSNITNWNLRYSSIAEGQEQPKEASAAVSKAAVAADATAEASASSDASETASASTPAPPDATAAAEASASSDASETASAETTSSQPGEEQPEMDLYDFENMKHEEITGPTVERDMSNTANELRENLDNMVKNAWKLKMTFLAVGSVQLLSAWYVYANGLTPATKDLFLWFSGLAIALPLHLAMQIHRTLKHVPFFQKVEERSRLRIITLALMAIKGNSKFFGWTNVTMVIASCGMLLAIASTLIRRGYRYLFPAKEEEAAQSA